jgi:hypothetical protein
MEVPDDTLDGFFLHDEENISDFFLIAKKK